MGIPQDPRRASRPRGQGRSVDRMGDPQGQRHQPRPETDRATWSQFLHSQADAILACDFFSADLLDGTHAHVLAVVEHATRRIRILGVTPRPTGEWTTQQARSLIMDLGEHANRVKFMIRDRGPNFTAAFNAVLADAGIRTVLCNVRTPRMKPRPAALRHPPLPPPRRPPHDRRNQQHRQEPRRGAASPRRTARPGRCSPGGKPTLPAAASASSPRSTAPASAGQEISVSGIARAARGGPHLPLPPPRPARASPRPGDGAACHQRHRAGRHQGITASRPARRARTHPPPGRPGPRQLERRLSEALGEQAWRESGLGAPADIDALNHKLTHLEQQAIDLRLQLDDRDQDLAAARAANRELISQLNATARRS